MNRSALLPKKMAIVLEELSWPPISPRHVIGSESRIVHDLGIIGDDWDSFYKALRNQYGKDFTIPKEYMPSEVSHDSAMVASAESWISRRLPFVQDWYIARLRCSPLTLRELDAIINDY